MKIAIAKKAFLTIAKGDKFVVNEANYLIDEATKKAMPILASDKFFKISEVEQKFQSQDWVNYNNQGKIIAVQIESFNPLKNEYLVRTNRKNGKPFAVDVKFLSKEERYYYIMSNGQVGSAIVGVDKDADRYRQRVMNTFVSEEEALEYIKSLF